MQCVIYAVRLADWSWIGQRDWTSSLHKFGFNLCSVSGRLVFDWPERLNIIPTGIILRGWEDAACLGVEVRASLAASHGQRGQGVLEDLLKAQKLDDGQCHCGVEAQPACIQCTLIRPLLSQTDTPAL